METKLERTGPSASADRRRLHALQRAFVRLVSWLDTEIGDPPLLLGDYDYRACGRKTWKRHRTVRRAARKARESDAEVEERLIGAYRRGDLP